MAIASPLRRRSLAHLRHICSASPAASAPPSLSIAAAKARLRAENDPDAALSILSSIADPPSSPFSARFAIDLTVRRLASSRRFSDIEALLEPRARSPAASQEPFLATVILSYGTAGMLRHALDTFERSPAPKTAFSFNAVLTACLRARRPRRIPSLFADLSAKHSIEPDAVSYALLSKSLSRTPNLALDVLQTMQSKGVEPNTVVYTTVLESLFDNRMDDEANKLWREMFAKGCPPDLTAYNVRAKYSAKMEVPEDILGLIMEMESVGLKPDIITYNYLLRSYFFRFRFKEAKKLYRGLCHKGCSPNAATYNLMLEKLSEECDFDSAAIEVYRESSRRNKIPAFATTRLLVERLVKESKVDEAKEVIADVKKKFPDNLLGKWKKLEKELGLVGDGDPSDQLEAA